MSTEPPSLAARLEQDGPLPWREAARLAARIARALDRLHAQGRVHGDVEPLTVLFVGGTVRLADPLPSEKRLPAFVAPWVQAGEPTDRAADFFALGRTMAAIVTGDGHAPADDLELPPPLAAVHRRLTAPTGEAAYGSGNEVAAALELATAASEGFVAAPPSTAAPESPPRSPLPSDPVGAPPARPTTPKPATVAVPRRRRRRPALVLALVGVLLLAGLAVFLLRPDADVAIEAPSSGTELPAVASSPAPGQATSSAMPPADPGVVEPLPLEEVLAALPEAPLAEPPERPETKARLRALVAGLQERPCSRLEVEPSPLGLRLVGSTASPTVRTELLAAIAAIGDVDKVTLALDSEGQHCRLYDMLGKFTAPAVPRLTDLYPPRADYRLAAAEPLVLRVLTPNFPSHVVVDYFTADGMVVHLHVPQTNAPPLPPAEELRVGDPSDGQWLTIAEPFGHELILVIASEERLFAEPRPRIEQADAYLDALEAALSGHSTRPLASTMAIRTGPAEQ